MGSHLIDRIFIKENLSFDKIELNFTNGLNVFTGISGSGKSVLFRAILSIFGFSEAIAKTAEADVCMDFNMSDFGIENEAINTFKFSKDKTLRYFINSQSISKKNLNLICSQNIKFLSTKDDSEFENSNMLLAVDKIVAKKQKNFDEILANFKIKFGEFMSVKKNLEEIKNQESKIEELKEFAKFEIDKIEKISPKIGEFDELMEIKKRLSKRDKINELWGKAEQIFDIENAVLEALRISDIDSAFFENALNELRIAKESLNLDELDELDIEQILDRIEILSGLNHRYGGEKEALEILSKRKIELEKYEKIEFEKDEAQKKFDILNKEICKISDEISTLRKNSLKDFEKFVNNYLKDLYMNEISFSLIEKKLENDGKDEIVLNINGALLKNLSSGELNRLKLAFIAVNADLTSSGKGVIFLDEIDSNLSGKEAMSIAEILTKISKFYQIFAISHQPQLSSKAASHFLVEKIGEKSFVKEIKQDEKITELARMISGEKITNEAVEFARTLSKN